MCPPDDPKRSLLPSLGALARQLAERQAATAGRTDTATAGGLAPKIGSPDVATATDRAAASDPVSATGSLAASDPATPTGLAAPLPRPASAPPHVGGCHCGAVRFRIDAALRARASCDCPHCQSRHIVLAAVPADDFTLQTDEQALALHPFHRKQARHYYCPTCGVYPFLRPRDANDQVFVNVFCLDDFDPTTLIASPASSSSVNRP